MPEDRYTSPREALEFLRKWAKIAIRLTSLVFLPFGILVTVLGVHMLNIVVFILGFIIALGIPFSLAIIIGYKYDKMLWGELHSKVYATYKIPWKKIPGLKRRIAIIIISILIVIALFNLSLMFEKMGNSKVTTVIYIIIVSIMGCLTFPNIREFVRLKNEACMQELEALKRGLTPEEKKRFEEVYKILFPSYDARKDEEKKIQDN